MLREKPAQTSFDRWPFCSACGFARTGQFWPGTVGCPLLGFAPRWPAGVGYLQWPHAQVASALPELVQAFRVVATGCRTSSLQISAGVTLLLPLWPKQVPRPIRERVWEGITEGEERGKAPCGPSRWSSQPCPGGKQEPRPRPPWAIRPCAFGPRVPRAKTDVSPTKELPRKTRRNRGQLDREAWTELLWPRVAALNSVPDLGTHWVAPGE